jgi:rubrerythrin
MASNRSPILKGLLKAIQSETEGHHFYRMAAQSTQDAKGREIFSRLAQEELEHQRFLRAQYEAVRLNGKPDASLSLEQPGPWSDQDPIFSSELRKRIGDAHYEMTALSVGIQLEINAQRFYQKQTKACRDRVVREFYQRLADWESGHYQALLKQQESLKDDYWSAGGFAPF